MVLKLQQALESPGGPPKTQVAGPRPECLSHRCGEEPTHLVMPILWGPRFETRCCGIFSGREAPPRTLCLTSH